MTIEMSRRTFLSTLGIAVTGTALASCAPRQPTVAPAPADTAPAETKPVDTPAPAASEPQQVTFTMYGHPNMIEQMVPLFNEAHSDMKVVFERSEGQGYTEKLLAAVAAGTAWDCFRTWPSAAITWGSEGVVADIEPYLDMDSTYPADNYLPGVIDMYTVLGHVYALPAWTSTWWLYYNKRMFDEAGLDYPTPETTWQEYVEMATALTKRDDQGRTSQYGTMGWEGWWAPVAQVVWSNDGCMFYNDDLTQVCVDDPKTIAAMQDIADLIHVHKTNPNPSVPSAVPLGLLSNNVATESNGDWLPWDNRDVYMEKYEDLDATLCPTRDGNRVNLYFSDPLVINSKSKVKEGAYRWISWFAADPQATAIQCTVCFPVTLPAYEDPTIRQTWLREPRPPGQIELALEHSKTARFWKVEQHIADIETAYNGEITRLWTNEATAEEVCRAIAKLGNEAMVAAAQ